MNKRPSANLEFIREDDYVEYFLFPHIPETSKSIRDLEQLRPQLEAVLQQCTQIVECKVKELSYIWHKDEFQLQLRTGSEEERMLNDENGATNSVDKTELPPHLHGVTHYGDNISDEWFIVYLLSELTREISGCIARVCDADGEFLLIEAADVLPEWANPDTCEQRVYIYEGALQLVQNSPSNTAKLMSVHSAVTKIRLNSTLYRVSTDIQTCIDERLKEFSVSNTNLRLHRQIVELPLNAAALLKRKPGLIASAIRAFCERDSVDTKALRSMRFFPPEAQRVRTNVPFTRCLYAMLVHSNYVPEHKIGWNLTDSVNTEEYKEQLLGIKLACGFEILAVQGKAATNLASQQDPTWRAYVRSLQDKEYFRDNLEGSEEYKRLLAEAEIYYKGNQARFRTARQVGMEVIEFLESGEINAEQIRDEENNLQPSDADDWINITAEQLDAMLQQRYGPKKLYNSNGDINAHEFTKNLSDFLEKQSAFDGIEHELDSDDDSDPVVETRKSNVQKKQEFKAKIKKNHSMRKACQQNPVIDKSRKRTEDEQENASTHVRNFLDFVIPEDNWDSNSEMSDYEDEFDLEHHFDAMSSNAASELNLDADIKAYMDQMDRELAKTTIGQTFNNKQKKSEKKSTSVAEDDDFDDIESFQPIDINVNTLKNMLDSYKSQAGGAGPVSNLFSAMGVGMSASAAKTGSDDKDLSESTV